MGTPATNEEKIITTEQALEPLQHEGDVYELPPCIINGHSLPTLIYDADAETIRSQGGETFDVEINRFDDLPVDVDPNIVIGSGGRGGYWSFGKTGSAAGHEKAALQIKRARALIRHVIS